MLSNFVMGKRKTKMKLSRKNGTLSSDDESDSDLQEFPLPKKRIIKPGKSTYIARRRCGCCRVCASVFLSVLLIASVLCVVVLGWFSLRLKRDLDFVRKRLSKVESFDRSTTREYGDLSKDITRKYGALKKSENEAIKEVNERYKSILRQIAHLNLTVDDLKKRVESPESANKITGDIQLLKKGMADTGGDITEIKDKIRQLTNLAGKENDLVNKLTNKFFNLSVQVAQVMGKPTPKPPKSTGTQPLILRMPVSSDEQKTPEEKLSFKNVSTIVSVEVARIMGIVSSVNHTLSHEVKRLRILMKSLLGEVKRHVATIDDLRTKVSHVLNPNISSGVSRGNLGERNEDVSEHLLNLTVDVTDLSDAVHRQSRKLAELMLEMVKVNRTVHDHQHSEPSQETSVMCNCSAEVGKLWEELSSHKLDLQAIQQQLQSLQRPVQQNEPKVSPAPENIETSVSLTQNQSLPEAVETDQDFDQEEEAVEDINPQPTPGRNASYSVKIEKVTDSPLTASSSSEASSKLQSAVPINSTSSPSSVTTTMISSQVNQTSPTESKVVKLSTPVSEETIEDSLETEKSESYE